MEFNINSGKKPVVQVKYFYGIEPYIEPITKGDWIDLRSAVNKIYKAGELVKIPLGIAMKLPRGFEAHMAARSSTCKNFGLIPANGFGIIDNSYCGDEDEWCFLGYAVRDGGVNAGDRICQFRVFENMPSLFFDNVLFLGGESRGGFGSTGIK